MNEVRRFTPLEKIRRLLVAMDMPREDITIGFESPGRWHAKAHQVVGYGDTDDQALEALMIKMTEAGAREMRLADAKAEKLRSVL